MGVAIRLGVWQLFWPTPRPVAIYRNLDPPIVKFNQVLRPESQVPVDLAAWCRRRRSQSFTHPIPLDSIASLLLLADWHTLTQKRYEIDNTTDSEEDFHSGDSSSMSDKEGD